ncbi:MAG: CHAT domain-containing protein [Calothrix sp. CSU_2_0]|nr:CHAT domain-containing protein [Calothrix sp. CSU_2_0]
MKAKNKLNFLYYLRTKYPKAPKYSLYALIVLLGTLFLFNSVVTRNQLTESRIAPETPSISQQNLTNPAAAKYLEAGLILHNQQDNQKSSEALREAIKKYEIALRLWKKSGDKLSQSAALSALGQAYTDLGETQKALEFYNQALNLRRAISDKNAQVSTLGNIALLERSQSKLDKSLKRIKSAIAIIEDLRTTYQNLDERSAYFASVQSYYKFHIDLLMQLHKKNPKAGYDAEALHISERSRARGLIELLRQAKANLCQGIDPKLLVEEERLQAQREEQEKILSQYLNKPQQSTQLIAATQKKIADINQQQQKLDAKIRVQNPEREKVINPKPNRDILRLPQIQKLLDKDTLMLHYSLGEERSYLWAITPNSITSYQLPKRKEIELAAEKFRSGIQTPNELPNEVIQAANEFSQIILAPVANKLSGKRLLFIGDGALQDVPFAALPDPNQSDKVQQVSANSLQEQYQPLMLNHEIVNLPSASATAIQRKKLAKRKPAPKLVAVFADPVYSPNDERVAFNSLSKQLNPEVRQLATDMSPLEKQQRSQIETLVRSQNQGNFTRLLGTVAEAKGILELIPTISTMQAIGFDANFNSATSNTLDQFRILHFATHGFVNYEKPELSGIVLSLVNQKGDSIPGFLRLEDIWNTKYPAELIVLSACETGLGKDVSGEGLVGLTRGLMYAGAERVVVSLWNVNDEGTSVLMQEFYKEMLQQKKTPAIALRAAQRKLWENKELRSPYFWAAFTLQGEWQ